MRRGRELFVKGRANLVGPWLEALPGPSQPWAKPSPLTRPGSTPARACHPLLPSLTLCTPPLFPPYTSAPQPPGPSPPPGTRSCAPFPGHRHPTSRPACFPLLLRETSQVPESGSGARPGLLHRSSRPQHRHGPVSGLSPTRPLSGNRGRTRSVSVTAAFLPPDVCGLRRRLANE